MDKNAVGCVGRWIFGVCLATALPSCGGGSDADGGVDPAAIAAAPQATKDLCERVCSAADLVRSKACGRVEFSSHAECYQQCVSRYLSHATCKGDFDDANNCIIDAGCSYETQCSSSIVFAAICLQTN